MSVLLKVMMLAVLCFLLSCVLSVFVAYGRLVSGCMYVAVSAEVKMPVLSGNAVGREVKLSFGRRVESLLVSPTKSTVKTEEFCLVSLPDA